MNKSHFLLIFPQDGDESPIDTNDMDAPKTAKALTDAIHALGERYHIPEFEKEFLALAKEFGASDDSLKRGEFNPVVLLEEGRKEDYTRFIKILEGMDSKYNFREYHDQCVIIRNAFEQVRKGYLYNSILTQCIPIVFFFSPDNADEFFEEWLDAVITKEESVRLEYETLEGVIATVTVSHKEDELTEDYVDCRPINRMLGDSPYDCFLVKYFWTDDGWVGIPINLIRRYAVI